MRGERRQEAGGRRQELEGGVLRYTLHSGGLGVVLILTDRPVDTVDRYSRQDRKQDQGAEKVQEQGARSWDQGPRGREDGAEALESIHACTAGLDRSWKMNFRQDNMHLSVN